MAGDGDSPDDEILEGLVKTAMMTQSDRPRGDRRKARQFNRKSCNVLASHKKKKWENDLFIYVCSASNTNTEAG